MKWWRLPSQTLKACYNNLKCLPGKDFRLYLEVVNAQVPERKPGITISSYVMQVSSDIPRELIHSLPQLRDVINYWEDECIAVGEGSARHYFLRQMIQEIRSLGY